MRQSALVRRASPWSRRDSPMGRGGSPHQGDEDPHPGVVEAHPGVVEAHPDQDDEEAHRVIRRSSPSIHGDFLVVGFNYLLGTLTG
jgi:hypothetical protein